MIAAPFDNVSFAAKPAITKLYPYVSHFTTKSSFASISNLISFVGSAVAVHITFTVILLDLSLEITYPPSLNVNVIYFPDTLPSATFSPLIAKYKLSRLSKDALPCCFTFNETNIASSFEPAV
ncbi:hypothetical protein J5751_05705 [bacterium]|nr:hypothetical protein [bacterium]